jgi:hypothetical protein
MGETPFEEVYALVWPVEPGIRQLEPFSRRK